MSLSINYNPNISLHGESSISTSKSLINWVNSYSPISISGISTFNNDIITNKNLICNNNVFLNNNTTIGNNNNDSLFVNSNIYINSGIFNNVSFENNVTIRGNLNVEGTTSSGSTTTSSQVSAPLTGLSVDTTSNPVNDSGIIITRGTQPNAFFGFDESTDKFSLGFVGSTSASHVGDLNITLGDLSISSIQATNSINCNTLTASTSISGTIITPSQTNITSVGTLNGGQISSNFGNINNGSSSITTLGTLTGGNITCNNLLTVTDINASGTINGNVTGNLTGNVTGDLTGNLTGNVTGNVTGNLTGNIDGTLDNYDSSQFFRREGRTNASVSSGWISVATCTDAGSTAGRYAGEILVTDRDSGDHGYIRIHWMRSFNDSNFTVINCGGHNNQITGARVLYETSNNTSGIKILQVYVTVTSNYSVSIFRMGDDPNYGTFTALTPVLENTKTGFAVHGNELTDLNQYGFAHEEGILAGGNMKVNGDLNVNNDVNITRFLKINNLNFCKIIHIGSTQISGYQSGSNTTIHFSTSYGDSCYNFGHHTHFNPDPSNYTIGFYLSSNVWTSTNNYVTFYYNNIALMTTGTWAGSTSWFRDQKESGIWHSWYQFPTTSAYGFSNAGSRFYSSCSSSFNYTHVNINAVLIHKSYMDYPKVSGISSTYDTANYRYKNNAGTTYYNMFS